MRTLNRMEFVGETLRAALEVLAATVPAWLTPLIDAGWVERYGARVDSYRFPKGDDVRTRWAEQVGRDGYPILDAIAASAAPAWLREIPAVQVLAWHGSSSTTVTARRCAGGRAKTSRRAETGPSREPSLLSKRARDNNVGSLGAWPRDAGPPSPVQPAPRGRGRAAGTGPAGSPGVVRDRRERGIRG
ncbi:MULTISPECIES: hypothetical protein [unclassified Micromonospora]|uniref:hypothetical protein n=1 Tax=unclassified Micromonospora TaxID=2617518 RepID=UPI003A8530E7